MGFRTYDTPLTYALDRLHVSREELARATGISLTVIKYYCSGYRTIPFIHARQIALALDMPISTFRFNRFIYRPDLAKGRR